MSHGSVFFISIQINEKQAIYPDGSRKIRTATIGMPDVELITAARI